MIIRSLKVKVFRVGNKGFVVQTNHAGQKKHFTADGIEKMLAQYAEQIEKNMPNEEYKLVQVGRGEFNFVHVETKAAA